MIRSRSNAFGDELCCSCVPSNIVNVLLASSSSSTSSNSSTNNVITSSAGEYVMYLALPCEFQDSTSSSSATSPSTTRFYNCDLSISCGLSNGRIQLYNVEQMKLRHTMSIPNNHATDSNDNTSNGKSPITDLCYHSHSNMIVGSVQDGSVHIFDIRQPHHRPTSCTCSSWKIPHQEEALSISMGYGGTVLAVGGGKGNIHFVDIRCATTTTNPSSSSLLGSYVESHLEEVTCLLFQSTSSSSLLASASEDGLLCTFDTSKPTEESALCSVMNVSNSIRRIGFFGPHKEGLFSLTGSETMNCWHHDSAQLLVPDNFNLRRQLSKSSTIQHVDNSTTTTTTTTTAAQNTSDTTIDYLIDAFWNDKTDSLTLIAGNNSGSTVAMHSVQADGSTSLLYQLLDGHLGCVRASQVIPAGVPWNSSNNHNNNTTNATSFFDNKMIVITGGEDSRLCRWDVGMPLAAATSSSVTHIGNGGINHKKVKL